MMQAVLQKYLGENITQYLSRMFRITKGIKFLTNRIKQQGFMYVTFIFKSLIRILLIKNMIERPTEVRFTSAFVSWGDLSVAATLSMHY